MLLLIRCSDQSACLENVRITQTSFVLYVTISQLNYIYELLQHTLRNYTTYTLIATSVTKHKPWAPHKFFFSLFKGITRLGTQKKTSMLFAMPMIWREPRDHHEDCYFCNVIVIGFSTKTNTRLFIQPWIQHVDQCNMVKSYPSQFPQIMV